MYKLVRQLQAHCPHILALVLSASLLLGCIVVVTTIVLSSAEPVPPPEEETVSPEIHVSPSNSYLVTAEQMAQLSYTDSVLGPLSWNLSEASLVELNQTLVKYNILTADEICHFLAQATVETGAGLKLVEDGDEAYFQQHGYTTGTRGAGYLHLTYQYGQMAFATWMMKRYVPQLQDITFVSPANYGEADITRAYYAALQTAANLGVDVSRYSRIVYDPNTSLVTGADYIAAQFAWESAGYYWTIAGIGKAIASANGTGTEEVSRLVGGLGLQSRREAYEAFYPILVGG